MASSISPAVCGPAFRRRCAAIVRIAGPGHLHGFGIGVGVELLRTTLWDAVVRCRRTAARADRPGHRRRVERPASSRSRRASRTGSRLAVELVDEGDDRNVAQAAHLEQFARRASMPFGRVDHHDGGVDRSACGRCLPKILVARRVEQVEDAIAIFERHHRSDDRIPRSRSMPIQSGARLAAVLRLARTSPAKLDRAAEQQQLFGERRLAGVGMRDDRECAAAGDRIGAWRAGRSNQPSLRRSRPRWANNPSPVSVANTTEGKNGLISLRRAMGPESRRPFPPSRGFRRHGMVAGDKGIDGRRTG